LSRFWIFDFGDFEDFLDFRQGGKLLMIGYQDFDFWDFLIFDFGAIAHQVKTYR